MVLRSIYILAFMFFLFDAFAQPKPPVAPPQVGTGASSDNLKLLQMDANGRGALVFPATVLGQNLTYLVGGNTVTSHSIFGNNANYDLIFRTNSTERMRILAGGNVGIGRSPSYMLDVAGSIRAYDGVTTHTATYPNYWLGGASALWSADGSDFNVKAGNVNYLSIYGSGQIRLANSSYLFTPATAGSNKQIWAGADAYGSTNSAGLYYELPAVGDYNGYFIMRSGRAFGGTNGNLYNLVVAPQVDDNQMGGTQTYPFRAAGIMVNTARYRIDAKYNLGAIYVGWGDTTLNTNRSLYTENGAVIAATTGALSVGTTNATEKFQIGSGNSLLDNNYAYKIKNASGIATNALKMNTSNEFELGGAAFKIANGAANVAMGGTAINTNALLVASSNVNPVAGSYGAYFGRTVVLTANNSYDVTGGEFGASLNSGAFNASGTYRGGMFTSQGGMSSGSTTSNMIGGDFLLYHTDYGTLTNGYAGNFTLQNLRNTGTITNAYGMKVGLNFNLGIMTNTYGINIGTLTGGTQTNQPYAIYSSDANARTYLAGNVGIGTVSSNAPLQFSQSSVNRKIVLYESGNNDHDFYGFGINSGVLRYQVANSADHVFYVATSSTTSNELMRIRANGRVGIGVASPTTMLDVNGVVNVNSNKITSLANGTASSDAAAYGQIATAVNTAISGSNGYIPKFSGANAITNSVIYDNSGNVGIGTTGATNKLQVVGRTFTSDLQVNSNASISTEGAYFQWNRSGSEGETNILNQIGAGTIGGIRLGEVNAGNVVTEYARFRSGNFGIGVTNPSAKLDVAGSGIFSGTVSGANASAATHLVNRQYADARYGQLLVANSWNGLNTFSGSNSVQALTLRAANVFVTSSIPTTSSTYAANGDIMIDPYKGEMAMNVNYIRRNIAFGNNSQQNHNISFTDGADTSAVTLTDTTRTLRIYKSSNITTSKVKVTLPTYPDVRHRITLLCETDPTSITFFSPNPVASGQPILTSVDYKLNYASVGVGDVFELWFIFNDGVGNASTGKWYIKKL